MIRPSSPIRRKTSLNRWYFWLIACVVLFVLMFGSYELGRSSVKTLPPTRNSAQSDEAAAILQKVSALIQLPNEAPQMAVISDAVTAKSGQPFLVNAENGDVLIIFQNAAQAIVYRPSTNKLIAVGPVYGNTQTSASSTLNEVSPPKSKK